MPKFNERGPVQVMGASVWYDVNHLDLLTIACVISGGTAIFDWRSSDDAEATVSGFLTVTATEVFNLEQRGQIRQRPSGTVMVVAVGVTRRSV